MAGRMIAVLALASAAGLPSNLHAAEARPTSNAPSAGLDAPLLEVDRFSDEAATLLRRSKYPNLPGPNQPIDLDDARFRMSVEGPGGEKMVCYNLDVRPETPPRYYVFYDEAGNYQLGQFPVVGVVPGDRGYSDVWDIWKVIVPPSFVPDNSIRDMAQVEKLLDDPASGYRAVRTGILLDGPIVPEGSSAAEKGERRGGRAAIMYAWYKGKRAPYFYIEGSLKAAGDLAPVSRATTENLSALVSGNPPVLRVAALAGAPGYSPLLRLTDSSGKSLTEGYLNCPVVGR